MQHFYNNPNMGEDWFSYGELYKNMVSKFESGSTFVELGCWKGKSAAYMAVEIANSYKHIYFHCIDSWPDSACEFDTSSKALSGDDLYVDFLMNVKPVYHLLNIRRMDSSSASKFYWDESVEFTFIDADHSYEGVMKDIKAWWPKIKKGGVLAGHDYGHEPIRKAVEDYFGVGDFSDKWNCGCFYIEKQ